MGSQLLSLPLLKENIKSEVPWVCREGIDVRDTQEFLKIERQSTERVIKSKLNVERERETEKWIEIEGKD